MELDSESSSRPLPKLYDYVVPSDDDELDYMPGAVEDIWSDYESGDEEVPEDLRCHENLDMDLDNADQGEVIRGQEVKRWRQTLRRAIRDFGSDQDFTIIAYLVRSIHAVVRYAGNEETPMWEEFNRTMYIHLYPLENSTFRLAVMQRLTEGLKNMKRMLNVKLKLRSSVEQAYAFKMEMDYVRCKHGREMPRAYHNAQGNELDLVVRSTPIETVLNTCFVEGGSLGHNPREMLHGVALPRMHPDGFREMALWIPEDDGSEDDYAFGIGEEEGDSSPPLRRRRGRRPCKCADDWSVPFWIVKHFLTDCVNYALFSYRASQRETHAMQILCRSPSDSSRGMSDRDLFEYMRIVPTEHPTYAILNEHINNEMDGMASPSVALQAHIARKSNERMLRRKRRTTAKRTHAMCTRSTPADHPPHDVEEDDADDEEDDDEYLGNIVGDVTLYKVRCVSLLCYHICNTAKAFKSRKGLAVITPPAIKLEERFECAVCYRSGDVGVTTRCLHKFCSGCLVKWVVQNHEFLEARCPMCRSDLCEEL